MQIHPREEKVQKAKLKLMDACINIMSDLTEAEYLKVLAETLSDQLGSIAKYAIRKERHPNDPDKPGGLL